MFIDMEKAKSYSDLVESFGTTKQSLLYSHMAKIPILPKIEKSL
jgi:hypothetical protein